MEITKNIRKDNQITKEKFMDMAQKIHESETKPIKIIGDEGAPTIHEVINNQKRLAVMIEYLSQLIESTK